MQCCAVLQSWAAQEDQLARVFPSKNSGLGQVLTHKLYKRNKSIWRICLHGRNQHQIAPNVASSVLRWNLKLMICPSTIGISSIVFILKQENIVYKQTKFWKSNSGFHFLGPLSSLFLLLRIRLAKAEKSRTEIQVEFHCVKMKWIYYLLKISVKINLECF